MKKRIFMMALILVLCLSGCSILPDESPIILDGDPILIDDEETKATKESKTPGSEETTGESTEETTEETIEESEEEWVELPKGGEFNPILEREIMTTERPSEETSDSFIEDDPTDEPEDKEMQIMQSYLTGEWKDVNVVNRRNIAVMYPNGYRAGGSNTSPRLTLYGLSKASIIYEAPVEGRITALMGIFEDYDGLDKIGPVAQSRDYFIYDAMSFDSIYVNWGMARIWVEELINSNRIDNISAPTAGIAKSCEDAFIRDYDIIPDAGKDYTGYLDVSKLKEAIESLEYYEEYRESFEQAFLFANDMIATYDGKKSITKIWPGGQGMNSGGYGNFADMNPHFEYDSEKHLYYRYQYGEVLRDGMNNRKIGVTNVVLKICHGEERTPNEEKYDFLAFGVHGTGDAYVFTNGKVIKGTWVKSSDPSADYLYDADGNEIVLNQGKTWVCCVWKEYSQYVTFE